MKKLLTILKKVAPWVVVVVIFGFLFKHYPLSKIIAATRHANILFLLLFYTCYFLYIWLSDCWAMARILSRFGVETRMKEILKVRASSYLITVLNYGAGQGALAFFLNRKKGTPFLKVSSIILFVAAIDLYWVISFAFVGSLFSNPVLSGISLRRPIEVLWVVATLSFVLMTLLAHVQLGTKLPWLQSWKLFHVLHEGGIKHYLTTLTDRLPMHLAINTSLYFVAWAYHVHIGLGTILASVPIFILIGTIPITPGGLGTVQLATVELLKDHVTSPLFAQGITPQEILLSLSLVSMFANYLMKAIFGSFFLRGAYKKS